MAEIMHVEAQAVTLGGKERTILLAMGSFRLAQMKHGATINLSDLMDPEGIMALLPRLTWVALLADDPTLTEEDALSMMIRDPEGEAEATRIVLQALKRVTGLLASVSEGSDEGKAQGKTA